MNYKTMDIIELKNDHRSIRKFKSRPVSVEVINEIVHVATRASDDFVNLQKEKGF